MSVPGREIENESVDRLRRTHLNVTNSTKSTH